MAIADQNTSSAHLRRPRSLAVLRATAGLLLLATAGCGNELPRRRFLDGRVSDATLGDGRAQGLDGGGPAADGGDESCATSALPIELRPLDMLLAVDTSGSMDYPDPDDPVGASSKWVAVSEAINAFVAEPDFAGLGVGLQYFPLLPSACDVSRYAVPAQGIATLPAAGAAIADSLEKRGRSGLTPIVPVLEGVTDYMRKWATDHPERRPIIVLATDGVPDTSCLNDRQAAGAVGGLPNTLANAAAVARAAARGTPSLSVFVVGVGKQLTALNEIAAAGGTGSAVLVDAAQNPEQAFLAALADIRRRAVFCELDIPAENRPRIDFGRVNVRLSYQGRSEDFGSVGSPAGCERNPGRGWHYDDPDSPTKIVLCEQACDRVQARVGGRLDVIFGCSTIVY
ncbi:MAG: VWA domain-containing protein [Proteobacteria bacterium]|nr:VWA domain-containing protein [Pseudomonadota bacterium]